MELNINCFEIEQPIGNFYIGYLDYNILLELIDVDEREYNTELERYMGIQRKLEPKRLKEIHQFITSTDATFPTSIVLSIKSEDVKKGYDEKENKLTITNKKSVFHVLDGQHRLYSFINSKIDSKFQLPITIIIDADLETQAHIFTKINLNQTRVNKSLTYDLFEYAKSDTPYKIAHNITQTLNFTEGPFYKKIKMLGKSDENFSNQFISQSAIVDRVVQFISEKPMDDTDLIKKLGFDKFKKTVKPSTKAVLQKEFLDGDFDIITQFFYDYFNIISEKWPIAWGNKSYILSKTTGIDAFTRAIKKYLQVNLSNKSEIIEYNFLKELVNKILIEDKIFKNENYSSGGVGQSTLYKEIIGYWGI